MRDINLLPPKQRQKRLALSLITYITFGFLMLLITMVGFAVTLTTIQVTINDKISNYSTQRQNTEKRITTFKSLEDDVVTINKALQLANSALGKQMQPNPILKELTDHTGPNISFSTLSITQPGAGSASGQSTTTTATQLSVTGTAKERADVIDFKRALEANKQFKDITYTVGAAAAQTSAAAPVATTSGLTFTLSGTIDTGQGTK